MNYVYKSKFKKSTAISLDSITIELMLWLIETPKKWKLGRPI